MRNNRIETVHIEDLALSNDKRVLSVAVGYNQRRGRIELSIVPVERNPGGFTMVALFGGPRSAYGYLEDCGRYSEKKLRETAEKFRAGAYAEIYSGAIKSVLEANGYILARKGDNGEWLDAYKAPEFEVGQRVLCGKDYGLIVEKGIEKYGSKTVYSIVTDDNWLWTNRRSDGDYGDSLKASERPEDAEILSAEQVEARLAECHAAIQERADAKRREDAEKEAAKQSALSSVRAEFPWAKQDGSSHARGAANLKMQLQMAFPGTSFSVTSSSYSMGDSLRVAWTDGPTEKQVSEISDRYQECSFDGMTDMESYRESGREFRTWMGGAKYVSESRSISPTLFEQVKAALQAESADVPQYGYDSGTHQVLARSEITGEFERLDVVDGEYVAIFKRSPVVPFVPSVSPSTSGAAVTVSENIGKGGVEVRFSAKPDADAIANMKRNGFRWSRANRLWYAKANDRTRKFAYGLAGQTYPAETANNSDAFDMHVEDCMAAAIAA